MAETPDAQREERDALSNTAAEILNHTTPSAFLAILTLENPPGAIAAKVDQLQKAMRAQAEHLGLCIPVRGAVAVLHTLDLERAFLQNIGREPTEPEIVVLHTFAMASIEATEIQEKMRQKS